MGEMTGSRLKEQALLIGPQRALVGVLTPPMEGAPPQDVTVVILNSGVIHRVGANRLHVELARDLARAGFRVLRFDLNGIGDSPPRSDAGLSILDAVMKDIRDAIDHVAGQHGRVALFGLCSGAGHALVYAPQDERVTALILLDLWIPRTRRYHWQRAWKRLTGRRGWINLLRGRHPLVRRAIRVVRDRLTVAEPLAANANGAHADGLPDDLTPTVTEAEGKKLVADAFRPLLARKVPILAVFTAGLEDQHNYATQLFDAFDGIDFGDRVQLEWFPSSDHTFSSLVDRRRLQAAVVAWISGVRMNKRVDHAERTTLIVAALWLASSSAALSVLSPRFFQMN
jgi:pimeloyl-ACP methyl ester carboxylesterase